MVELKEKANNYAEENVISVLKEAFAKVYADGYRNGYKDCQEEIPVDLRNNQTEFVDLGLPSGTLWSAEYEKEGENIIYLPYDKASLLDIPTVEQYNELLSLCRWESMGINSYSGKFVCVGPNGKTITFKSTGIKNFRSMPENPVDVFFWLKDKSEDNNKTAACLTYRGLIEDKKITKKVFMGFKQAVRLVTKNN